MAKTIKVLEKEIERIKGENEALWKFVEMHKPKTYYWPSFPAYQNPIAPWTSPGAPRRHSTDNTSTKDYRVG